MPRNTRVIRASPEFVTYAESVRRNMQGSTLNRVTFVEATKVIASANTRPIIIQPTQKKRRNTEFEFSV